MTSTIRSSLVRWCVSICACFAAGCSGGGSGDSGGATATISATTAQSIASGVVTAAFLSANSSQDLGGAGVPTGASPASVTMPVSAQPAATTNAAFGPTVHNCNVDGQVTVSGDVTDPDVPMVGDQVDADFAMCDDGTGLVFDGSLGFTIQSLTGTLQFGDSFDVSLDLVMTGLAVTDSSADTVTVDGDGTLDFDTTMDPLWTMQLAGNALDIAHGGDTFDLADYTTSYEFNGNPSPALFTLAADGRLTSSLFTGDVDYQTLVDLEGEEGAYPYVGELLMTGNLGASIHLIADANATDVHLQIDLDGNGSVDALVETTWAALGI